MIAKGGRMFVALSAAAAVVSLPFSIYGTVGFAGLASFLVFMFRDPRRAIGEGIVAPADGKVRAIDEQMGLVSTYLALSNVHVTRAPLEGTVTSSNRSLGKHSPAYSDRTDHNERLEIRLSTKHGEVSIIEMTGAIARRIVPYIDVGQRLLKGEKMSLIRFGSRVDLYLPPDKVNIIVKRGDRLKGGITRIAEDRNGRVE